MSQSTTAAASGRSGAPNSATAPDTGSIASMVAPSGKGASPGQSLPPNPPPGARFNMPTPLANLPSNVKFGPGFEIRSDDDEYIFQFHDLTQLEYRGYLQGGQTQVHDTFDIPRQWFMFTGRISKPFGYFVSLAEGFDTTNILDVFMDADFSPKFRVRYGRFKTPFTYEFLVEPIQGLVTPERSIFFNNFGQNRDLGIMPYGRLFNGKVDYAGGIFNGTRNGFLANQDGKYTSWFVNYRPFGDEENTLLENLNIGGSVFAGNQDQPPIPQTLRTVVPISGNTILGVPFLTFNNNVRMSGPMAFWDLHLAYFYQGLAFISEWGSGYQDYALSTSIRARTHLPIQSFYVQASYLLTGETRSSIGIVKPLNPISFGRGEGWSGTGAIEPYFKYEYLDIGNQVFTNGLADPNLFANRLFQTHVGVNWHLTQYTKIYFDWNHAEFNNPVEFAPNRRQKTSDAFVVRFQLYF
jgi:phosphate-selective porin OprO/OprP